MKTSVSISKARAHFPSLLRKVQQGDTIAIYKGDETIAYVVPRERWEAILETMEIMANPKAMKAIREAEAGKARYYPVAVLDEDEG